MPLQSAEKERSNESKREVVSVPLRVCISFQALMELLVVCGLSFSVLCSIEHMAAFRDQPVSLTGMCGTECWPVHWTEQRALDRWCCLARGLLFYGCVADCLALRWAHGSAPDGCWDSGGHRAEKSHQAPVPGPCTEKMKRTAAPRNTGQTLQPLNPSPLPTSTPLCTYFLHPLIPTFPLFPVFFFFFSQGKTACPTSQNMKWGPQGLWASLVK